MQKVRQTLYSLVDSWLIGIFLDIKIHIIKLDHSTHLKTNVFTDTDIKIK